MAKIVKRLSWYQVARILKCYQHGKTVLEHEIEDNGSEWAIELEQRLKKASGYGYYEDEFEDEDGNIYYNSGFAIPSTKALTKVLKDMFIKVAGNKVFLHIEEDLVKYIPQDPPKKRWHQIDRCHRKWGWGVA